MADRAEFEAKISCDLGFTLDATGEYLDCCAYYAWEAWKVASSSMEKRKDDAYLERNKCVALLARMALTLGLTAGTTRTAIEGWSNDWHGCVYVDLPAGQVSWHFHDSQSHLFSDLPRYEDLWDGHDTDEKYRRVQVTFGHQCGSTSTRKELHRFLDSAAGEGLVLGGVDAADLYAKLFPAEYAAAIKAI